MEHRRKFECIVLVAGLMVIVSPSRSFAGPPVPLFPAPAIPESSNLLTDKTEGEPLFLSLSLSMSPPSIRQATLTVPTVKNDVGVRDEAEGEPLPLSLSISSASTLLAAKNSE